MSPQKQNKTILWIAAALVIAIAVFALCYLFFAPQAADGAKTITIAVTDEVLAYLGCWVWLTLAIRN